MRENPLLALLLLFAPLSLLSVGGGQSVVAEMQRQVVDLHGWMSDASFMTDYAIARMAPGPGSLVVALVGWQVAGLAGALVATAAMFIPSALLVCALAHVWSRQRGAPWQRAVERGLMPVAAGMILATSYALMRSAEGGWLHWMVTPLAALAVLIRAPLPPLVLVGIGGGAFMLLAP
jgi:chromate transporter